MIKYGSKTAAAKETEEKRQLNDDRKILHMDYTAKSKRNKNTQRKMTRDYANDERATELFRYLCECSTMNVQRKISICVFSQPKIKLLFGCHLLTNSCVCVCVCVVAVIEKNRCIDDDGDDGAKLVNRTKPSHSK